MSLYDRTFGDILAYQDHCVLISQKGKLGLLTHRGVMLILLRPKIAQSVFPDNLSEINNEGTQEISRPRDTNEEGINNSSQLPAPEFGKL